jgi:hypothetical protein
VGRLRVCRAHRFRISKDAKMNDASEAFLRSFCTRGPMKLSSRGPTDILVKSATRIAIEEIAGGCSHPAGPIYGQVSCDPGSIRGKNLRVRCRLMIYSTRRVVFWKSRSPTNNMCNCERPYITLSPPFPRYLPPMRWPSTFYDPMTELWCVRMKFITRGPGPSLDVTLWISL